MQQSDENKSNGNCSWPQKVLQVCAVYCRKFCFFTSKLPGISTRQKWPSHPRCSRRWWTAGLQKHDEGGAWRTRTKGLQDFFCHLLRTPSASSPAGSGQILIESGGLRVSKGWSHSTDLKTGIVLHRVLLILLVHLTDDTYFYLSNIFNAGLLLVKEYFYSVVSVLSLK